MNVYAHQTTISTLSQRDEMPQIRKVHEKIVSLQFVQEIFDALPNGLMILNPHRQIVFLNGAMLAMLAPDPIEAHLGLRPGEVFNCIHSRTNAAGCGTTDSCRYCDALQAVLESQATNQGVSREVRLTVQREGRREAFDFSITVSPFDYGGVPYRIISLLDISHRKRRQMLERIFFHDIAGMAANILQLTQMISEKVPETCNEHFALIRLASKKLVEEIKSQKALLEAENDSLTLYPENVFPRQILDVVADLLKENAQLREVSLVVREPVWDLVHETDASLILRVLVNLVKNALEASKAGQVVTMGCRKIANAVQYWVHNEAVMIESVRAQVFQRSFSTKGHGRGLGTYSIKLLTEKYLQGTVTFVSEPSRGTTFSATYPSKLA